MNKLVLIRGPICAGKSTITELLYHTLGAASLVDQDLLKRNIDRKRSDWRSRVAFSTALYFASLLMKENRDIIVDIHSSIPAQYTEYAKLALRNDYKLFSFLLYPPLKVCLQRNKKRPIPNMQYRLTDDDIKTCWKNVHEAPGETVLDTSILKPEEVVSKILMSIQS